MIYMTKPERKQEKTHNLCFQGSSDCSLVFSLCIVFFLHNWFLFFLGCHQSHNAVCTTGKILKCLFPALARVTQEVGASFMQQKVADSIPIRAHSQVGALIPGPGVGTCDPSPGTYGRQPVHSSLLHRCFSSFLSPFLSLKEITENVLR